MTRLIRSAVAAVSLILVLGLAGTPASATTLGSASSAGWTIVPSPNASSTVNNNLYATSCTSSSFCVAVGNYRPTVHHQALIERWNGSSWSIVPSPNTSPSQDNYLFGVSCSSPSSCTAVGNYSTGTNFQTLIERWNGQLWSIVASPDMSTTRDNYLSGVSCITGAICTAVGAYDNGTNTQTLIEQWNGTAWSIVASSDTSALQDNYLEAVSCTTASACTVVGASSTGTQTQTLIEEWNGAAWAIAPSAAVPGSQGDNLFGVSCSAASSCSAVGEFFDGTHNRTLIEQWNGSTWTLVASPTSGSADDNFLESVSCSSASLCTAVGYLFNSTKNQTLVEQWNGSAWSIVSSPNTSSTEDNFLYGVSCAKNGTGCVAAGTYSTGGHGQTLIEALDVPAGYWEVASDGGVFGFGSARFFGSTGGIHINQPVVGMAATADKNGYWMVAGDGGIFSYGDAGFYGSTGGSPLNKPIVGMVASPDGGGYWEVASDGGIFSFGSAPFLGSAGGIHLNRPIVGMAASPNGDGYWLIARDGGIFTYGDVQFYGSKGSGQLNKPIVGIAATPDGFGYWLVAADGGVFTFGSAKFYGSTGGTHLNQPIVGMDPTPDGKGYWLVASDGGIFSFGDAAFLGSMGGTQLNQAIVGMG